MRCDSRDLVPSLVIGLAAVAILVGLPVRAAAQSKNTDYPTEFSGGYSFLHDSTDGSGTDFKSGAYAEFETAGLFMFGFEGEISGDCDDEDDDDSWMVYTFMAGPTIKLTEDEQWRVFADLLVGVAEDRFKFNSISSSSTHFAIEPGIKAERMFNNHWGARAGVGLRFVTGDSATSKEVQATAGVVFRP